jgi:hypothetical protein
MSDGSQPNLSDSEIGTLREVAGIMVPADSGFDVPGADDPAIMADIVKSVGRDLPLVRQALAEIEAKGFADLGRDKREALINDIYGSRTLPIMALGRVILGAYYRDDRVLLSLKLEARAPFPKGYTLEQGDWSLLDAVRRRQPLWRDDRKELAK